MNYEMTKALYRLGMTAACMARGLTAEEAVKVHERLEGNIPADSIDGVYREVDEAIRAVLAQRDMP